MLYQTDMDKAKEYLLNELKQTRNKKDKEALQSALDYIFRKEDKYKQIWGEFKEAIKYEIVTLNEKLVELGLYSLTSPLDLEDQEGITIQIGLLKENSHYFYSMIRFTNYKNQEFRVGYKTIKPSLSSLKKILQEKIANEETNGVFQNIHDVLVEEDDE